MKRLLSEIGFEVERLIHFGRGWGLGRGLCLGSEDLSKATMSEVLDSVICSGCCSENRGKNVALQQLRRGWRVPFPSLRPGRLFR